MSIDGGKPATIQKTALPFLQRLVKEGAHSWDAETVLPSLTLPSHGSMVSGVEVRSHGLSWNNYSPERGTIKTTTMFTQAKAAGLTTALIAAKEKFKHLNTPGSIDSFSAFERSDFEVAAAAADLIKSAKPNLTLIHLGGADSAGHKFGWDSPSYLEALKIADDAVGTILSAIDAAGIGPDTLLIVTSDHGGIEKSHGGPQPAHRKIPWIIWGKNVKASFTLPSAISTMDTAATALWALGVKVPSDWQGVPVTSAMLR